MNRAWYFLVTLILTCACLAQLPSSHATPTLNIDCGPLEEFEDENGEYLLFNPTGVVRFQGKEISYRIYYTKRKGVPLKKQSRHIITNSFRGPSQTHLDNFDFEKIIRNDLFDGDYFNSPYLEFTIQAKVPGQISKWMGCIYRRR